MLCDVDERHCQLVALFEIPVGDQVQLGRAAAERGPGGGSTGVVKVGRKGVECAADLT